MGGSNQAAQLALPLTLEEHATLDNFLPVAGTDALRAVLAGQDAEALHYLHGPAAVGKSHLLQAACHAAPEGALYLPLAELVDFAPEELMRDLESGPLIAIDDIHLVAGDAAWEEALFHLINRCRASGCRLVTAARQPPGALKLALPDLQSRLSGGLTWALRAYTDPEKLDILNFRGERRGLVLPPAVLDYLAVRGSRSLVDMLELLERLDEASLQAKRPLTVPLVREVMG